MAVHRDRRGRKRWIRIAGSGAWVPWLRVFLGAFCLAGMILGASACFLLTDTNAVQCASDNDCTGRGEAFAGSVCMEGLCAPQPLPEPWTCLNDPPLGSVDISRVSISMQLVASGDIPVSGIRVETCGSLDVDCSAPLAPETFSSDDGTVQLSVQTGFNGYVQLSDPRILTSLVYFNPPVVQDTVIPAVVLLDGARLASFAGETVTVDDSRGHVFLTSLGCDRDVAAGATFSVDPSTDATRPFYFARGFTVTGEGQTDSSGAGGFYNVPVGFVRAQFRVVELDRSIAGATLLVRAGAITYSTLGPEALSTAVGL